MKKTMTRISIIAVAVIMFALVFAGWLTSKPFMTTESAYADYVPNGFSPISTEEEFVMACATGGRKYLTRDINMKDSYNFTLSDDLILDLNGYSIGPGNWNFIMIYTNGHDLTLVSSQAGTGSVSAQVWLTMGPQGEKSNLAIYDGVTVMQVTVHRENGRVSAENLFDKVKLKNGKISFFYYSEDAYVEGYWSDFNKGSNTYNRFIEKFEFGEYSLYANATKVTNVDEFWDNVEFSSGSYASISAHNIACLPNPAALDTTLTLNITRQPTLEQNGIAIVKTVYDDEEIARTNYGREYTKKWYRSVNGAGYQECNGYTGNFAITGNRLEDRNIELGANSYTYYTTVVNELHFGNISSNTAKYTIYSKPYAPSSVGVNGQTSVNTGADVTLTGIYVVDNRNVGGNIVKNEYRWQQYNTGTDAWEDITGNSGAKLTYKPSTAVAGSTQYRLKVRSVGKGANNYSDWAISNPITFAVGEYDSPVVTLDNETEIEKVVGQTATLAARVANSDYFDSISYQWYYVWANAEGTPLYKAVTDGTNNGYTFANTDSPAMTVTRNSASTSDLVLHCTVTGIKNGYKRVVSSEDTTVNFINLPVPTITKQPTNLNLMMANGASWTIDISATTKAGVIGYQWQTSADGLTGWTDIVGATSFGYNIDRTYADEVGTYYRCVVTNDAGSVNSDAALVKIKDGTVLTAEISTGLTVAKIDLADPEKDVVIDNDNRTVTCHLGDTLAIGFTGSYVAGGNVADVEYTLVTNWRKTSGLSDYGVGTHAINRYVNTDMAGTFEYYGSYTATYNDQVIVLDNTNTEELTYTVIVLPNDDVNEIDAVSVDLGDVATVTINFDYSLLFSTGGISTNSTAYFYGNNQAKNVYGFIKGYRLFIGIPNEIGEIQYVCVANAGYYGQDGAISYHYEGEMLEFDTSAANLTALGITEALDGAYDAYIVMDYHYIVDEDQVIDGDHFFNVKFKSYESHHFTLTVNAPCTHEHVTTTYTFDYTNPEQPEIFIWNKCDECDADLPGSFIRIDQNSGVNGLPVLSQAATCTEDGMREHKHFTSGEYDIYYVKDANEHWVVCEDVSSLIIKAGHNYQAVAAVDATCTTDGNIAHYECSTCHAKFLLNGETYYEADDSLITVDAYHKHLVVIDEKPATTEATGVKAYYYCPKCGKYFSDVNAQNEIADLNAWKSGDGKIDKLPVNPVDPSNPDNPSANGGLSAGALIGIIAGAVVVLAAGAFLVLYILNGKGIVNIKFFKNSPNKALEAKEEHKDDDK